MKWSLRQKKIIPGLVIILFSLLLLIKPGQNRIVSRESLTNKAIQDIIPNPPMDSQLVIYKRIDDSLQKIIRWKKQRITQTGSSLHVLFAGISRIDECDSCIHVNEKTSRMKYFISLNRFELKSFSSFFIDKNDYTIERHVLDKDTGSIRYGHTEQQKVRVRLGEPVFNEKGLTLLIPVSSRAFQWIEIGMYIFLAVCLAAGIWLFIILPVRVLANIANGKPFLKKNIKYLNYMGWGIIGSCLLMVIIPKLIELFFSSMIPPDIYFPFWSSLFDLRWWIFLGVAILLLAQAFKQGYKLQQEQDLTI